MDTAATRDLEFLVADGRDYFSEEKRDTTSEVGYLADGVPAYRLVYTCKRDRYRVEKVILTDPRRSTVLLQAHFVALQGRPADYSLCVLLAPHLGNRGADNTAWVGAFKGVPMLFARRGDTALALACSAPWRKRSAGFVGTSDGWQDLSRHRQMTWEYGRAANGNVALTGEVDLAAGRKDEAANLLRALEGLAGDGGLLPEQVWDTADIPARELYLGRPTGSAMPLVWAHAEYVKLCRSLHDRRVFDTPEAAARRYARGGTRSPHVFWRLDQRCRFLPAGKVLRVEVEAAATVRWSADGWQTVEETKTRDTALGIHRADLPTDRLGPGAEVVFTLHWQESGDWQGENFQATVRG